MGSVSSCLTSAQVSPMRLRRWYLYDITTDLLFRKRLGFIEKGVDVDGLLAAFRNTGWIIGLMALFPYLLGPLFQLPFIGKFFLPRSGNSVGVGKVMRVIEESLKSWRF